MEDTSNRIVHEKLAQAADLLDRHQIDVWLTFARETSLTKDPALEMICPLGVTWHSAFLIGRRGETVAIVGRHDAGNVERLRAYSQVVGYDASIRPELVEALRRLSPGRVAINFSESDPAADGLTHGMKLTLDEILAEAGVTPPRIVSAEHLINSLRGQKTPSELAHIREAVAVTEMLFAEVGQRIRPGVTERELADFLHRRLDELRLETAWERQMNPIVNTGPDSAIGHSSPSDLAVRPGHLVHFDFGVKQSGFCADLQRVWYVLDVGESEPPQQVRRMWHLVRGALEAGAEVLKPGAQGWEVDAAARSFFVEHGVPEYMHAFGHHVGRVAHDGGAVLGPRWDRYGQAPNRLVEPGNVFAIELGALVPGKGWIYLEENVLVAEHAVEPLSNPQTELMVVAP